MQKYAGMYFKKISERLEKRANAKPCKWEFTFTQGKVLWYLHQHEDEDVTLRDVENFLDCSHATVSGLVSRLEEKGFVVLEPNAVDKRAKTIRVTEKDRAQFKEVQENKELMENTLLKGFSDAEREELLNYLERIYANLEE